MDYVGNNMKSGTEEAKNGKPDSTKNPMLNTTSDHRLSLTDDWKQPFFGPKPKSLNSKRQSFNSQSPSQYRSSLGSVSIKRSQATKSSKATNNLEEPTIEDTVAYEEELQDLIEAKEIRKGAKYCGDVVKISWRIRACQVIADWDEEFDGDVSIREGQLLKIVNVNADGWWDVEDEWGQKGTVPSSFLRVIDPNDERIYASGRDLPGLELGTSPALNACGGDPCPCQKCAGQKILIPVWLPINWVKGNMKKTWEQTENQDPISKVRVRRGISRNSLATEDSMLGNWEENDFKIKLSKKSSRDSVSSSVRKISRRILESELDDPESFSYPKESFSYPKLSENYSSHRLGNPEEFSNTKYTGDVNMSHFSRNSTDDKLEDIKRNIENKIIEVETRSRRIPAKKKLENSAMDRIRNRVLQRKLTRTKPQLMKSLHRDFVLTN